MSKYFRESLHLHAYTELHCDDSLVAFCKSRFSQSKICSYFALQIARFAVLDDIVRTTVSYTDLIPQADHNEYSANRYVLQFVHNAMEKQVKQTPKR